MTREIDMRNQLQEYEKVNVCGLVWEGYCRHRCWSKKYPQCDRPLQKAEIEAAKRWIKDCCWERKIINWDYSSYGLKHVMERETRIYVTNGAFIKAAMLLGYSIKSHNSINVHFNMGIKTNLNRRFWANSDGRQKR